MMGNFMPNQSLFNPNLGMQNTMMNNQFQNNFYNNNMNMGNNINMNMMNNMNMNQNNMNFNGMMDMNANNMNMDANNMNNNINFNNINNNAQNDEQQKAQALALLKKKEAEDRKKLFSEIINKESGENLDKINTISDMSNMAAITRNYIEVDSAQNPNKYLPIGQALNSPDQDYLILGILADYLQKQGVITAIEKRDQNQLSKEKLKEIDTFLQFLINGLTNLKKHELRFDFGWERNNLILTDVNEQDMFMNELKVGLSRGFNIKTNEVIKDKETINKCLKSKDFFLVRNYMKKYKLISGLSKEELIDIKNNFEDYIDALDMDGILNNYLFVPLTCIVCKNDFSSVYEVLEHKNCINGKYHPPCVPMENCQHKGCQKRFKKGEYNCCHKKLNEKDSGCLIGEGKHIFVINNK
jgi:hypothetical protein